MITNRPCRLPQKGSVSQSYQSHSQLGYKAPCRQYLWLVGRVTSMVTSNVHGCQKCRLPHVSSMKSVPPPRSYTQLSRVVLPFPPISPSPSPPLHERLTVCSNQWRSVALDHANSDIIISPFSIPAEVPALLSQIWAGLRPLGMMASVMEVIPLGLVLMQPFQSASHSPGCISQPTRSLWVSQSGLQALAQWWDPLLLLGGSHGLSYIWQTHPPQGVYDGNSIREGWILVRSTPY